MSVLSRGKKMLSASILPQKSNSRGRGPQKDAEFWVQAGLDRDGFEIQYISHRIGSGVFATKYFSKGEFLMEYVGELTGAKEAGERDQTIYRKERHSYLYYFRHNEKNVCIDASRTYGRLGRMVNDSKSPNSKMKKIYFARSSIPHLVLFSTKAIQPGEQILCDYGDENLPWRKESALESHVINQGMAMDYDSDPFDLEKCKSVTASDGEDISSDSRPGPPSIGDSGTRYSTRTCTPKSPVVDIAQQYDIPVSVANCTTTCNPATSSVVDIAQQYDIPVSATNRTTTCDPPMSSVADIAHQYDIPVSVTNSTTTCDPPTSSVVDIAQQYDIPVSVTNSTTTCDPPMSSVADIAHQYDIPVSVTNSTTTCDPPTSSVVDIAQQYDIPVSVTNSTTACDPPTSSVVDIAQQYDIPVSVTNSTTTCDLPMSSVADIAHQYDIPVSVTNSSTACDPPTSSVVDIAQQYDIPVSVTNSTTTCDPPMSSVADIAHQYDIPVSVTNSTTACDPPTSSVVDIAQQYDIPVSVTNSTTTCDPPTSSLVDIAQQYDIPVSVSNSTTACDPPTSAVVDIVQQYDIAVSVTNSTTTCDPPTSLVVDSAQQYDIPVSVSSNTTIWVPPTSSVADIAQQYDIPVSVTNSTTTCDPPTPLMVDIAQQYDSAEWVDSRSIAVSSVKNVDNFTDEMDVVEDSCDSDVYPYYGVLKDHGLADSQPIKKRRLDSQASTSAWLKFPVRPVVTDTSVDGDQSSSGETSDAYEPSSEDESSGDEEDCSEGVANGCEQMNPSKSGQIKENPVIKSYVLSRHFKDISLPEYNTVMGQRNYRKRDYCLYCGGMYQSKNSVHYKSVHCMEKRVADILALPVGSPSRKKGLLLLQNEGNYKHNMRVIKEGRGELVVSRRLHAGSRYRAEDFLPCEFCYGFVVKDSLWKHVKTCFFKPHFEQVGANYIRNGMMMISPFLPEEEGDMEAVLNIIDGMKQTAKNPNVKELCRNDELIKEFGLSLIDKLGMEEEQRRQDKTNIRTKLRTVARLLSTLQSSTSESHSLMSFITGRNFMAVVQAVKELTIENDAPNLALTLGHYLKHIALLKRSLAIRNSDDNMKKEAGDFLELFEAHWNAKVSSVALRGQKLRAINKEKTVPATKDLVTLRDYLDATTSDLMKIAHPTLQKWRTLAQHILVRIVLFNKRRIAEVQELQVSDFVHRPTFKENQEIIDSMTVAEKMLAKRMSLIEVRGKSTRGIRKIFVLLTPEMVRSVEHLLRLRQAVNIRGDNRFIFANEGSGPIDGCRAFREITAQCPGISNPGAIRSTKLRKYLGTTSQILDMKDSELKMLADYMGHDTQIHANYYRLQSSLLEKSKVATVLIAVENGMIGKFGGRQLESIDVEDLPAPVGYEDSWQAGQEEEPQSHTVNTEISEEEEDVQEEDVDYGAFGKRPICHQAGRARVAWREEEIVLLKTSFPNFRETYPSGRELEDLKDKYSVLSRRSVTQLKSKLQHLRKVEG